MVKHKAKNARKQHQKMQGIVPAGAPLFTRNVTLRDVQEIRGSSVAGNGFQRVYASSNGVSTPDSPTPDLPQPRIFNQYAPMFEYYQINRIHARFIPYKWEISAATAGTNIVNARPTYSIIDPEIDSPLSASGFMSYGNCHVTVPYATNTRQVNYMNLALQKQDTLILRTNGSHDSRQTYSRPVAISFLVQCPAFITDAIGIIEYSYDITFSGQVGPGLDKPNPQSTLEVQISRFVNDEPSEADKLRSAIDLITRLKQD